MEQASYLIVNRQLQDLIRIQESMLAKATAMCNSRNENMVPHRDFERISRELEDEKLEHIKTKAKLVNESEKLEFAFGEIDILNKQLQREKAAFEKVFGNLKHIATEESQAKEQLMNKCGVMEVFCSEQDDILSSKDAKIKDLKTRLVKQKQNHKQQLSDLEIQRQQQRYIVMNTQLPNRDSNTGTKRQKRVSFR